MKRGLIKQVRRNLAATKIRKLRSERLKANAQLRSAKPLMRSTNILEKKQGKQQALRATITQLKTTRKIKTILKIAKL